MNLVSEDSELEQIVISKTSELINRIQQLEESKRQKDIEISVLKHALENVFKTIDMYKDKLKKLPKSKFNEINTCGLSMFSTNMISSRRHRELPKENKKTKPKFNSNKPNTKIRISKTNERVYIFLPYDYKIYNPCLSIFKYLFIKLLHYGIIRFLLMQNG